MSGAAVWVWVDGELVDPQQASLRAVDHGVTVGDGAFETAKVIDGHVFAAARHRDRMDRSLHGLGLPPADHDAIGAGIEAVLEAAGPLPLGRLRYTVTGGAGPLSSERAGEDTALTYIVTLTPTAPPAVSGGIAVVPWVRNERGAVTGLKTTSYAENVVALSAAHQRGAVEAVMANTRDELCEGTGSNIFVVTDGALRTPPLDSGCLAGITRALVVQWCREADLEVREEAMPLSVLQECDEAFLTSSIKDVFPIDDIDGRSLALPGPVTSKVQDLFSHHVARTISERLEP